MAAARRAASYLALRSEPTLQRLRDDPAALDAFCATYAWADGASISDAALAAAGADSEEGIAAVSRALLQTRVFLRAAGAMPVRLQAADVDTATPDRASFASVAEAIDAARRNAVAEVAVPRAFLRTIDTTQNEAIRLLRAAFSNDDDALIRAAAPHFDVAELRAAQRLVAPRSLRAGLVTAGAAFRGGDTWDRALQWARHIAAVRRAGRRKRGALGKATAQTGVADEHLRAQAAAADAVWDADDRPPSPATRVLLLCDSRSMHQTDDGVRLVPLGCVQSDKRAWTIDFDPGPSNAVSASALGRALDVDETTLGARHVRVRIPLHAALAQWLLEGGASHPASVAWPIPEPVERVVAPAMTFSASRLNLFVKCPRRWYYEYLCAAVEEKSTANAAYGKVFHAALEALHRDVRFPADWEQAVVLDRLCGLLDVTFGQSHGEFASQLEYEVLRLRARQVARHYVRWLYEEAADAPLEIVEIESRQTLLLRGHRFVGYIDRVDRPPGGGAITIFDYKTGRIEEDPEEYLRLVRSGEEAQLALYYAMRRAQGDDVARVALVSIRDARDKAWILALDITDEAGRSVVQRAERAGVVRATCSIADLERSLDALTARCDTITREGFDHFAVGADPPCSYCAYAPACRERPGDGERIFAR